MITLLIAAIAGIVVSSVVTYLLTIRNWPEPTTPTHARLVAKPGATLDLVTDDGVVQAKVVLSHITWTHNKGTNVEFEDYFNYIERNTYRRG